MNTNLRAVLSTLVREVDFNDPELTQQANAVDVSRVETQVDRMVRRAAVISHAFDVMKAGSYKHPLAAFVHATECPEALIGGPLDDQEYFFLLDSWARLVRVPPAILTSSSYAQQGLGRTIGEAFDLITAKNTVRGS